jgi:hypothetical protein
MKKYLAAVMTGLLLLGSNPVFSGHSTPRTLQEKKMQEDNAKRNSERKAFRADLKRKQDALSAQRKAEMKAKKAAKKAKK